MKKEMLQIKVKLLKKIEAEFFQALSFQFFLSYRDTK